MGGDFRSSASQIEREAHMIIRFTLVKPRSGRVDQAHEYWRREMVQFTDDVALRPMLCDCMSGQFAKSGAYICCLRVVIASDWVLALLV